MEFTGMLRGRRGPGLLAFALFALPAAPSFAGYFGICGLTARVASMEEIPVFGAGSRRITSETDPSVVLSSTFPTLVTLDVKNAYLIDGRAECERMMMRSDRPQRFVVTADMPAEMRVGAQVEMMWEYFLDVTPDGNVYQERWTLTNPER